VLRTLELGDLRVPGDLLRIPAGQGNFEIRDPGAQLAMLLLGRALGCWSDWALIMTATPVSIVGVGWLHTYENKGAEWLR